MRLTIPADKLRAAVEACAAIALGGQRPQLEATLIEVLDSGVVEIAATNQNDALWFRIAGATKCEPGKLFTPSANLFRTVKLAGDRDLTVQWETGGRAKLSYADVKVGLPVEPPEDFPAMQRFDPSAFFVTLAMPALSAMLKRVNFSVMGDFKTRTLAGVNIEIRPKSLRMTATDGVRMATVERDIENQDGKRASAIVPPITPKFLKTFTDDTETEGDDEAVEAAEARRDLVDVQVTEGSFRLRGSRGELTRRTIVGTYPDYDLEKQLSATYQSRVDVDSKTLKELLETASLIKANGATTCEFRWSESGLEVDAASGLDGAVSAKLPLPWKFPPFKIRLDPGLLSDAVKVCEADTVELAFGTDRQPALLREVDEGLLYLYCISSKF